MPTAIQTYCLKTVAHTYQSLSKNRLLPIILLLSLSILSSCYYSHREETTRDRWDTVGGTQVIDSAHFYQRHHYWINYNLSAIDTFSINPEIQGEGSSAEEFKIKIQKADRIVVADIRNVPTDPVDSIWVKIARDQMSQGWVRESELLSKAVPDSPISKFIHYFSDRRSIVFISGLGVAILFILLQAIRRQRIKIVHFNDIDSPYPTLLCITVACSATLYGTIQHFAPVTWVEFYFHPTLSPFGLPPLLSLFIASVWLIILLVIAVMEELGRQTGMVNVISYFFSLTGTCILLYLFFTLTIHLYIGYPLLLAYSVFALLHRAKNRPGNLLCGQCGQPIPHLGRCKHCGALNK